MNAKKRIKMLQDTHDELHDPDKREEALRKQDIEQMKEDKISDAGL